MENDQDFTQQSQPPNRSPDYSYGHGELAPGTTVDGRYTVRHKLGEGGMAVVYLVEQIFLKEIFALKVLTTGLSDSATVRFQKEAQVCRLLDHPNLIKVVDFAILENDSPYLVMEYVDGESLADILKRKGQLSEAETIDIFMQIMDGLAYAHEQNVIHRDLKPSNVMLANRPDMQLHVKILDFGIAKMTGQDSLNAMTLTNTGEIFGSPLFMSPEQCLGRRLDFRSDLYSIGCALYQVLTGAPPFSGDSALATMMLHLEGTPLPLKQASLGKEFSPGIEKVVMKLLQKLPDERYQSARDVYDDLDAVRSKRALKKSEQPKESVKSQLPVSRAVIAMIALCSLLIVGSIVALFLPKNISSNNSTNEERKSQSASTPSPAVPWKGFFANCSIAEWKSSRWRQGPWTLNFPSEGVGKVTLARDPRGMDVTLLREDFKPAEGAVKFEHAAPLLFATPLFYMKPEELKRFRSDEVQQLRLEGDLVGDKTIASLVYFGGLQALFLDNCLQLTDDSLQSIANLHNLVYLHVKTNALQINPFRLGQMVANSNIDVFFGTIIDGTDSLCRGLSTSKKITILRFADCDITEKGIEEIAKIPNLEVLNFLKDKNIKSDSLAKIVDCKKLKQIGFHDMSITADSFRYLKKLPSGCQVAFTELPNWSEADQKSYEANFPNGRVP